MGYCLGQAFVLTESVMEGNYVDFGGATLSAWRYLVPGPGSRVATTGPIHPEHNRALLETFEQVIEADPTVDADGLIVVPGHESDAIIHPHLAKGGWAVGFGNVQFPAQVEQRVYVVLPSLANARFILPRSKLGAALSLYNPSRPLVRLALGAMRGRLASSLAWFGGRVVIAGGASEHLLIPRPIPWPSRWVPSRRIKKQRCFTWAVMDSRRGMPNCRLAPWLPMCWLLRPRGLSTCRDLR